MPVSDPSSPGGDPLIGRVLSERYRILRKVGEGGMGTVYQAEHALIEKKIALKVLFPELTRRPELVARFLQEAKSASRIGHENVIDISDFGQSPEGMVYIAMEFLEGHDLAHLIKSEGTVGWMRARPILMQIAKALRAAHEHGIIHRDMKPENVFLVQREGRPDFVKVLDFGIAKVVNPDADSPRLTQAGTVFGTPEYMSPEQAQGLPPDHRVDVYAVGCLMYHMLTGAVPFTADNFMGILTKHLMEAPVPPRQRRPDLDIPEDVEEICLRALEKDRDKRWQDMDALFRALGGANGEPFESSGGYGTHPSLRLAVLPQAAASAVSLKGDLSGAVVAARAAAAAATEAEPEGKPEEDDASARAKLTILLAGGAIVLAALMIPKLRGSHRADEVAAPAAAAPAAAAVAGPAVEAPAPAPIPTPAPTQAAEAAATEDGTVDKPSVAPSKPAGPRPRHRRAVAEAAETATAPAKGASAGEAPPPGAPPTPAELKNPFSNP
jgi:serine/threonine-protein kinase